MSGIDPRLIAWLEGSRPAQDAQEARRRLAMLERNAGIAAQNVANQLQPQIDTVSSDVAAIDARGPFVTLPSGDDAELRTWSNSVSIDSAGTWEIAYDPGFGSALIIGGCSVVGAGAVYNLDLHGIWVDQSGAGGYLGVHVYFKTDIALTAIADFWALGV